MKTFRNYRRIQRNVGLIGCFSADRTRILATAWEPCQELFQGVIVCLHCDFRLGDERRAGLEPGERRTARGKIYLLPGDPQLLLARFRRDFPPSRWQRGQK